MSAEAPKAVVTYLQAKFDQDLDRIVAAFADDAVVHDEGNDHVGADAIRTWATGVSTAFEMTRTVLGTRVLGAATLVDVQVAGNFPGSPVDLHHHFTVSDERITALTICT